MVVVGGGWWWCDIGDVGGGERSCLMASLQRALYLTTKAFVRALQAGCSVLLEQLLRPISLGKHLHGDGQGARACVAEGGWQKRRHISTTNPLFS